MDAIFLEEWLVISLATLPVSPSASENIASVTERKIDWSLVLQLAARWEVESIVLHNLVNLEALRIPGDIRRQAAAAERKSRAVAVARTLQTTQLVTMLAEEGINTLVLKGPALAVQAYGDASWRPFTDTDLLLRQEDVPRAVKALLKVGYHRDFDPKSEAALLHNQHALEFSRDSWKVELHCSLISRHLRLEFDMDELWEHAIPIECAGSLVKGLAPAELFLYLCAHGAKHEWERLRWVTDLAQLTARLSPEDVIAVTSHAKRLRSRNLLLLGLIMARDLAGADVSRFDLRGLGDEHRLRRLANHSRERMGISSRDSAKGVNDRSGLDSRIRRLLYWVRARESVIDRVWIIMRMVTFGAGDDAMPGSFGWLRRPLRLANMGITRRHVDVH